MVCMSAARKTQSLTHISSTYIGWYDIRTGILHPVIKGSTAENISTCLAAVIRKWIQFLNGWYSIFPCCCWQVWFFSPVNCLGYCMNYNPVQVPRIAISPVFTGSNITLGCFGCSGMNQLMIHIRVLVFSPWFDFISQRGNFKQNASP